MDAESIRDPKVDRLLAGANGQRQALPPDMVMLNVNGQNVQMPVAVAQVYLLNMLLVEVQGLRADLATLPERIKVPKWLGGS